MSDTESLLEDILSKYGKSFKSKIYSIENEDYDLLMNIYGIVPALKRENKQYWGRELGMCWQRLVVELARQTREDLKPGLKVGIDQPCDLIIGNFAIDTKYRIGSGDSGTLKKIKSYGQLLINFGYSPTLLILREDNLESALTACRSGGWDIKQGEQTYNFLEELTGFNIKLFLLKKAKSIIVTS